MSPPREGKWVGGQILLGGKEKKNREKGVIAEEGKKRKRRITTGKTRKGGKKG